MGRYIEDYIDLEVDAVTMNGPENFTIKTFAPPGEGDHIFAPNGKRYRINQVQHYFTEKGMLWYWRVTVTEVV